MPHGASGRRRDLSRHAVLPPAVDHGYCTVRRRNSELSADDLRTWQGVVLGRAVSTLRSVETRPLAWGFVSSKRRDLSDGDRALRSPSALPPPKALRGSGEKIGRPAGLTVRLALSHFLPLPAHLVQTYVFAADPRTCCADLCFFTNTRTCCADLRFFGDHPTSRPDLHFSDENISLKGTLPRSAPGPDLHPPCRPALLGRLPRTLPTTISRTCCADRHFFET